ncbi:MAG: protein translocase subunit SecD [Symploca sp. SIO3C6]|uniref:Protein translocase subunit SecD n=1 Tax=Symploca sp. SIO1C4 TaxID=2607765 RepID=A0A6B3NGZ0_9CYAN|nr:protein translocase subunit SecD [Symploca sp. SIO3C6]NER29294.1 protein translocase subunit SecD [Symploca sp. SIO1C4]
MQRQRLLLGLIVTLLVAAVAVLVTIPIRLGLDLQGGSQLTIQVKTTEDIKEITADQLEAVQFVIERRVNGLGVSESVVQTVGADQMLVQLPGVSDPEEAERVLGGTAQLDFRGETSNPEIRAELEVRRQELLQAILATQQSSEDDQQQERATQEAKINKLEADIAELGNALYEPTELTGKNLTTAFPAAPQIGNNWSVAVRFDSRGGELFAELTKNIAGTGRTLGIFLDDELISSPVVDAKYAQTGITGGSAEISGNFTAEGARELALQLEGGALPLPVEIIENRTVGATLGRDSIERSIYAAIVGLILVLVFMGIYYRLSGLIADIALIIYSVLTIAAFSLLGVTLTLPGIAGFILSIGMAVDANVLIFERTREELRAGKSLYRSVESGFYRAFSSILDANVTTLIACAVLFWLGSGLVKGFAVTLAIGVSISMFTALTCSRTLMLLAVLGFPQVRQKPELFCPNLPASARS